jgi:hypothetical protein
MLEDVQYTGGYTKKMDLQDQDLASKAYEIIQGAMEALQRSTSKLRKLRRGADQLHSGSEVGSIMQICQVASGKPLGHPATYIEPL